MRHIATVYQGAGWTGNGGNPAVPGIQAVFEEKNGPPDYGTRQISLTEGACSALLQEPLSSEDCKQIERALTKIADMGAFRADLLKVWKFQPV